MLVDGDARRQRRTGQAEQVIERMEMPTARVEQAAVVERALDMLGHLGRHDHAQIVAPEVARQQIGLARYRVEMRRLPCGFEVARFMVAGNGVALDPLRDPLDRHHRHGVDRACPLQPKRFHQVARAPAQAGN